MSADEVVGVVMVAIAWIGTAYWLPFHITGLDRQEGDR